MVRCVAAFFKTTGERADEMPKYTVTVRYHQTKDISVYARDEDAAAEKAVEIVEGWNGVDSAEAESVEEE